MQEKPWASGEENAYNIIKHGAIVLYGHLFVLQKKCSSLYLVALIKHLFYYKEMNKETLKKYILIIKYMWMSALVYSGAWTPFSCSFALWSKALDPLASWPWRHSVHSTCPQCLSSTTQTFNLLKESSHQTLRSANTSRSGSPWVLAF